MIEEITITSLSGRGSVTMRTRDAKGYWLGLVDWGQAEGSHQTYSVYNQPGATITNTQLGTRSLTIPGWIIEDSEKTMISRCEFLNSFISPAENYELAYNGRKIQFRPDSSVVYSRTETTDNEILRKFLIQATCPFPLFSQIDDYVKSLEPSTKLFTFPTDFGRLSPVVFGITGQLYNTVINNPGGFSTGVTITINFTGNVTNPRIKNLVTGQFVGVNYQFSEGDLLTICTVIGKKSITLEKPSGETTNLIKYRNVEMSWLQLLPGDNIWAIECEDIDQRLFMDVTIAFTPLYLEVE